MNIGCVSINLHKQPGDLRFPSLSDVTTKLNKRVRDQFASGRPLLDSCVTDQVPSEAVFWTKLEFKEILGERVRCARLEAAD